MPPEKRSVTHPLITDHT